MAELTAIDPSDIRRTLDNRSHRKGSCLMGLTLVDLTADELAAMRPAMISGFAESVADNYGVPLDQAMAEAATDFDVTLPDGVATRGQLLRKAMDGDTRVGFLWISLPGTTYPEIAWLSEVEVAADQRSKGYGSRMIRAGEADLAGRGVPAMGLHVFGHNHGARRLYDRLGYRVLSQIRSRPAGPVAEPAVTLAPMAADDFTARRDALLARDPFALVRGPAVSVEQARRQVGRLAPDGVDSPGVHLCTAHRDGREVGWIWYSEPTADRPTTGMIYYVAVAAELRRRGLGRAMVAAAGADLAGRGAPKVGLSVPGRPEPMAFAAALDTPLTAQQMIKDLQP